MSKNNNNNNNNNNKNNNNQKRRTCKTVDFAVVADHRIKLKESEKKDKYLDLVWELKKKLWNMNVTIIIFTNPSAQAGYDTRSIF